MPEAQGTVTVRRTDPDDISTRQIILTIDGAPFATLLTGQQATRAVPAGAHKIRANNTLYWKTLSFTVAPGEHAIFDVGNRMGPGTFSLLGLLGAGPMYLRFEHVDTLKPDA